MYSSSSSGYDGSYTASSDKTVIGLCGAGHFTLYSNSSDTVNAGSGSESTMGSGSTAMMHGTKRGNGSWNVINRDGNPILILDFYDGSVHEYNIAIEEYKPYLNGTRYFKTSGERGPNCDQNRFHTDIAVYKSQNRSYKSFIILQNVNVRFSL